MSETKDQNTDGNKWPQCVGIIPDGNRRWAKERGLTPMQGHEAGMNKWKEVLGWAVEANVRRIIAYGFSTENWSRPKAEIDFLLTALSTRLAQDVPFCLEHGIKLTFIGDLTRFSDEIQEQLKLVAYRTQEQKTLTAVIALNYGGRDELVRAVNKLRTDRPNLLLPVTEEEISAALDTAGIPDPDMIIRTSGEQRLSGFLPWQSVYSELFFPSCYWPDLTKEIFMNLIEQFRKRKRRFGQ